MHIRSSSRLFHRFRVNSWCAILSLALLPLGASSSAAQSVAEGYTAGTPWEGAPGVRARTWEIMARERLGAAQQPAAKIHPRFRPDFQNLPSDPSSPDVPSWPPGTSSPATSPRTPQTLAVNFTGATLADTRSFPPDSMGAAGPSQFIVAVNGRVRTFNKTTGVADGVLNADTDVFYRSVLNPGVTNNFTSDPRIRYDRLSGRWFINIIDVPGETGSLPNHVLIAVSDSSTITANSTWTFFSFQQDQVSPTGDTGKFADYDTLGIDANALYIGVNIFGTRGVGSFSSTTVFVVRKSSVLGSGPIIVTAFRNLVAKSHGLPTGPYTPQGVDNYDPAATEGYVIGVDAGVYGKLQLRRISNPGGTPSISGNITITIPLNGGTIGVPHLGNTGGTSGYLDGSDYRLLAAHVRNGRLWTTANIAVDNTGSPSGTDTRMGVRWYELSGIHSGQTPAIVQSGTVFQSSAGNTSDQRSYWMGAIMVSGQGHAAMGFSVAGINEHANAGTVGRLAQDALGTMRTPVLYTASSSAYNPSGDSGGTSGRRWGDYSYTSLDPSDDMTMWTIQEFCNATDSYGVQVVRLLAPPPATPSTCAPSSVATGTANVNVLLTGTSNGDSGFFDPGPGFSNRISAAVSGSGVLVNSISYTDPTHLTLNLSVAANAPSGARTIAVTNPDGQSATSASAILTVTGATNNPPVAGFVAGPTTGTRPLAVSFTNLSSGALSYSWDFGDGQSSTNFNPANLYSNAGDYSVKLTAVGPGGTNSLTRTNYILVTNPPPPVADFVAAPTSGSAPLTVYFTNLSTAATSYDWDFGDGQSSTNFNPADTYSNAGVYSVKLTAAGPGGTNSLTRTFYILVTNVPPPVADFVAAPTSGSALLTVYFTNLSTAATSYDWDFGDGQSSTNFNPANIYSNAGNYSVKLTAVGPGGANSLTRTNYILVANVPPPVADFVAAPTSGSAPLTVYFTNLSSASTSYGWDFGDGHTSADANPGNFYANAGTYTVTLTALGPGGTNTLMRSDYIVLTNAPPPVIEAISVSNGTVTLTWSAVAGQKYRVQHNADLGGTNWVDLSPDVTASGPTASTTDPTTSEAQRFYRVQLAP